MPLVVDGKTTCGNCAILQLPCTWHHHPDIINICFHDLFIREQAFAVTNISAPSMAAVIEVEIDEDEDKDDEE